MAKGQACPNCGEQTFHRIKGTRKCSTCGARGWLKQPTSAGSGKGQRCHHCGSSRFRRIARLASGTVVKHCYGCRATVLI